MRRPIQLTPDDGIAEASPVDSPTGSEELNRILSAGIELFDQGIELLKVDYEEPTVQDVEALNLAVSSFYSMMNQTNQLRAVSHIAATSSTAACQRMRMQARAYDSLTP